ncbi:unnamed protein product [Protopolystoma xenopodis]|uniref:Uncharacterized protein n=1 Tax=Protopolystoma xenopodis TaxID=117903 RepID=A0A448WHD3_9PLAT|nr:unnamed protein product [Protopolystoma xenopodis]
MNIWRHAATLVNRIASFVDTNHLRPLSLIIVRRVPFAYHLAQMVYDIIAEETEDYVLSALELAHCLVSKLPDVFINVFYRIGLMSLIRLTCGLMTTAAADSVTSFSSSTISGDSVLASARSVHDSTPNNASFNRQKSSSARLTSNSIGTLINYYLFGYCYFYYSILM